MKPLLAFAITILVALAAACDGGDETVGPGAACGGRGGAMCGADQYCDFTTNLCGTNDVTGVCRPRPASCPQLLVAEPTCGCDQRVYSSPCDANLAGTDLNQAGTCPLGTGAFACGYRQCNRTTEYCEHDVSDVGGLPDDFECRGLPSACGGAPSCGCLAGQTCAAQCAGSGASGLTLTCPGG
jgi:hypothetical protein